MRFVGWLGNGHERLLEKRVECTGLALPRGHVAAGLPVPGKPAARSTSGPSLGGRHLSGHFGREVVHFLLQALAHHVQGEAQHPGVGCLSICSTVCLSFFTKAWLNSDTSSGNFCTPPSTLLATISAPAPVCPRFKRPGVFVGLAHRDRAFLSISSGGTSALVRATVSWLPHAWPRPSRRPRHPGTRPARDACAVQVGGKLVRAGDALEAAEAHVLADLADQAPADVFERRARSRPGCKAADPAPPTSAGLLRAISSAAARARARKLSFLVTKSVSQLISSNAPVPPSIKAETTPSAVMRAAALPALLPSLIRQQLLGLVHVAVGLGQGLLALHHRRVGLRAQFADHALR